MTWFKVDDGLAFHAKVVLAGNAAMGLWVRAGSWCAQMLTDGFIPDHMISALGTKAQAKALIETGLWVREESGYRFHEWLEYNPTAEEVRADQARKHEAKAAAGRAGGLASGVARRKHTRSKAEADGEANAKQNRSETKPRPVPSRPVPFSGDLEGGVTEVDAHETPPPLIPGRCAGHQYDVVPPKCGACKDARIAAEADRNPQPLRLVTDTKKCWVHDLTYTTVCAGCRADEIAHEETA